MAARSKTYSLSARFLSTALSVGPLDSALAALKPPSQGWSLFLALFEDSPDWPAAAGLDSFAEATSLTCPQVTEALALAESACLAVYFSRFFFEWSVWFPLLVSAISSSRHHS